MTWNHHHTTSELLAIEAQAALQDGQHEEAEAFYRQAALAERDAFEALPLEKLRTRGITAVSSVALGFKGRNYQLAEDWALHLLATARLPRFAEHQLRELLRQIWEVSLSRADGCDAALGLPEMDAPVTDIKLS